MLDLRGNPNLVAESTLILNDTFPLEMKGNWSIGKVTTRGDTAKQGIGVLLLQVKWFEITLMVGSRRNDEFNILL
jgi:hypothetical protein